MREDVAPSGSNVGLFVPLTENLDRLGNTVLDYSVEFGSESVAVRAGEYMLLVMSFVVSVTTS